MKKFIYAIIAVIALASVIKCTDVIDDKNIGTDNFGLDTGEAIDRKSVV